MASKDTKSYWKKKITRRTIAGKQSANFYARMSHGGRQEFINLNTGNPVEAATAAVKVWVKLKAGGWEAVKPKKKKADGLTVGGYLAAAKATGAIKPNTFDNYARRLRTLAAEIKRKPAPAFRRGDAIAQWKREIDALALFDTLNKDRIDAWREKRLKGLPDGEERRKATNTVNSILADAKSLFGRKVASRLRIELPANPFEGVTVSIQKPSKFTHDIPYDDMTKAAQGELEGDQLLVFMLAASCGLRRSEIDRLRGCDLNLTAGKITITDTDDGRTKTGSSQRTVNFNPQGPIAKLLKGRTSKPYAVCPDAKFTKKLRGDQYRCDEVMLPLAAWLKAKGVREQKPIHYLRKACGDVIVDKQGIAKAASTLGNSIDVCFNTYHARDAADALA